MLDLGKREGPSLRGSGCRRPGPARDVAPGVMRKESDLRGPKAVAGQVEEVEVLQCVRADDLLGRLDRSARSAGTSSGEISVARMACRIADVPCPRRRTRRRSGSGAGSASSAPRR